MSRLSIVRRSLSCFDDENEREIHSMDSNDEDTCGVSPETGLLLPRYECGLSSPYKAFAASRDHRQVITCTSLMFCTSLRKRQPFEANHVDGTAKGAGRVKAYF